MDESINPKNIFSSGRVRLKVSFFNRFLSRKCSRISESDRHFIAIADFGLSERWSIALWSSTYALQPIAIRVDATTIAWGFPKWGVFARGEISMIEIMCTPVPMTTNFASSSACENLWVWIGFNKEKGQEKANNHNNFGRDGIRDKQESSLGNKTGTVPGTNRPFSL